MTSPSKKKKDKKVHFEDDESVASEAVFTSDDLPLRRQKTESDKPIHQNQDTNTPGTSAVDEQLDLNGCDVYLVSAPAQLSKVDLQSASLKLSRKRSKRSVSTRLQNGAEISLDWSGADAMAQMARANNGADWHMMTCAKEGKAYAPAQPITGILHLAIEDSNDLPQKNETENQDDTVVPTITFQDIRPPMPDIPKQCFQRYEPFGCRDVEITRAIEHKKTKKSKKRRTVDLESIQDDVNVKMEAKSPKKKRKIKEDIPSEI